MLSPTLWAQQEPSFPNLAGRVTDLAKLLNDEQKATLDKQLAAHEAATSNQIVVVTVKSLEGMDIADYALKLGRKWGIGTEEKNNGVLLVVAPNERKVRIEVGYGLEGALPDSLAGTIVRGNILPSFRESDYPRGITNGVNAIEQAISGEYTPPANVAHKDRPSTTFEKFFPLIFIGFIGLSQITERRFKKPKVSDTNNPNDPEASALDTVTKRSSAEKAAKAAFPAGFAGLFVAIGSGDVKFGILAGRWRLWWRRRVGELVAMTFLTQAEKQTLATQIREAESKTSAEIVTVIADQSDHYRYIPTLWVALLALAVPGIYFLFQHFSNNGWTYAAESADSFVRIYYIQVLVFLGLGMLIQYPLFRFWLVPKSVKHSRASRHAREQFLLQNLHQTASRTGVMVFVSVAEHYVEIIVDTEVAAVVDNDIWVEAVDEFVMLVKRGQIAQGFSRTISHCDAVLSKHFPDTGGKPDELPNNLIEIFLD